MTDQAVLTTTADIVRLISNDLLPKLYAEKERLDRIDKWARHDHDDPYTPAVATAEYKKLRQHAPTPWLSLVVTSVAQSLFVDGYRRADAPDDSSAWQIWQANGLDARQIAIHRAALTYGASYVVVLPGESPLTGESTPVIRGVSPRHMLAWYEDPAADEWPVYALQQTRGVYRLLTADHIHTLTSSSSELQLISSEPHDAGVCPVVRYANLLDLEGRTDGEVEPYITVAARIDQTTFDRLLVQRFSSWVVRTVSGMSVSETTDATGETAGQAKMRLSAEQLLIASDPDTRFGSLPATPLDGFIAAHEADVRSLAAVTQTPAHELLGQMANLSAEALAAARASLTAKVTERQHSFGESHEQMLRLASALTGDLVGAGDYASQVRWRDTEIRSLAQAADALGKLATMLGVPVEILWEKIPGWTDQDLQRAKALAEKGGTVDALMRELLAAQQSAPVAGP